MSLQFPDVAQSDIVEDKIDDSNDLITKTVTENQDNSNELFS